MLNSEVKFDSSLKNTGDAHCYINERNGERIAKVLPGFYYISNQDVKIVTVLGSCVAACIRDPIVSIGGMNHFMLPFKKESCDSSWSKGDASLNRYGNYAMKNLIDSIVMNGGDKNNLEIKIFGGGKVLDFSTDIGALNIAFVNDYLESEGLEISTSDLGTNYPRKVVYDPVTGKVGVKKLRSAYRGYVAESEMTYLETLRNNNIENEI